VLARELLGLAPARAVGEGLKPFIVVPLDPLLDGAAGAAQQRGDLGGGVALLGQDHNADAVRDPGLLLPLGRGFKFFNGVAWLDVHGSSLTRRTPSSHATLSHTRRTAREIYDEAVLVSAPPTAVAS